MALINFQKRFANDVESGKKRQTIRKQRKHPFKLNETLYLYTGFFLGVCLFIICYFMYIGYMRNCSNIIDI